jgi:hypothetical protein
MQHGWWSGPKGAALKYVMQEKALRLIARDDGAYWSWWNGGIAPSLIQGLTIVYEKSPKTIVQEQIAGTG